MNFALIALQVRCSKNSCLSLASKCQSYFRRHHRREYALVPVVLESGTPGTLRCPVGFDIACIGKEVTRSSLRKRGAFRPTG